MQRVVLLILFAVALASAQAQDEVPAFKRNYVSGKSETVEKAREAIGRSVDKLSSREAVDEDVVKVGGKRYMPLYTVDLYKGTDSGTYKSECRRLFLQRYPSATITSVVIPQTQWLTEDAIKGGSVIGHTQTLYCFIIAADGDGGFLNARFAYRRYAPAGGSYTPLAGVWPQWERADALTAAVYAKLLKK